jgi:hypothetical protein
MALNKKVSKNHYSFYTLWLAGEAARKLDLISDAVMVANGAFFLNK